MIEFEKHWDFTGLSEHVNYHPNPEGCLVIRVPGINRKEERREGWKAALELVAGQLSDIEEHRDIIEFIEKELGTVIFTPDGRNEYAII